VIATATVTTAPSQLVRRASLWEQGSGPRVVEPGEAHEAAGIVWLDLAPGLNPDEALPFLADLCPGLERKALDALLTPDVFPESTVYGDGAVRIVTACSTTTRFAGSDQEPGDRVGTLGVQPVELLAGEGWLISCWQAGRIYSGSREPDHLEEAECFEEVYRAIARRWPRCQAQTGGDLGVLIIHELALSYAAAYRAIRSWLEDWELELYEVKPTTEYLDQEHQALRSIWGLRAVMRDWINPLNKPGLRMDVDKAWLPATNHQEVKDADDRIDQALSSLSRLGDTLRASFNLLHLQRHELEKEKTERTQRWIERIAAVFLIPTLVVGFYGANTWVPGEHQHWGFWIMVIAMACLTVLGLVALWFARRERTRADEAWARGGLSPPPESSRGQR
jgi:CorA-like Mg2+ transporter protein